MARLRSVVFGVTGGLVLAALVVTGCVMAVSRLTGGSASDHARNEVQSLFVNPATARPTAHVQNCGQIGANAYARIYLCDVVVPSCTRIFRFAVYRDSYGATPVFAPMFVLRHPCTLFHT